MVFQCINIRQVPWKVLKTAVSDRGFQHLPRDLANVNALKIMFDPYIEEGDVTVTESKSQHLQHLLTFLVLNELGASKTTFLYELQGLSPAPNISVALLPVRRRKKDLSDPLLFGRRIIRRNIPW